VGRVEKFKEARMTKFKFVSSITLFFIVLFIGIIAVDYSLNSIVINSSSINVLKIEKVSENKLEIDFANKKYNLNTTYINRDLNRLKQKLSQMLK